MVVDITKKKRKSNIQIISDLAFLLHENAFITAIYCKAGSYTQTKEFNVFYTKGLPKPPDYRLLKGLTHNGKPLLKVKLQKLESSTENFRYIQAIFID